MRSATPHAAGEGPSSAGLFRARPGLCRHGSMRQTPGPSPGSPALRALAPAELGAAGAATGASGSEPPKRLSAIGGLQLPSPTSGHRTGHQAARNKRPCSGIEHPDPHPALIHTRRLELNANGDRGGHRGNREGQSPNAPTGGNHCDCRPGSPASPLAAPRPPVPAAAARWLTPKRTSTENGTPLGPAACSLRATERAVSRGMSRGFCTGRPRRPMWTVTRGSDQALLLPG